MEMRFLRPLLAPLLVVALLAAGCGNEAETAKRPAGPPPAMVSALVVQARDLEVVENVVGSLENVIDPSLGAEVAGRVVRVHAFTGKKVKRGELLAEIDSQDFEIQSRGDAAEIARLQSLMTHSERVVERQQKLVSQGFISQNAVDDAVAQRNALRESITAAGARAEQTRRSLGKTRVVTPIDGEVEVQIVAAGDYVKIGDPLFKLVGTQRLHAHLPLPETAGQRIRPGLKVRLSAPSAPGKFIDAKIDEIRPTVGAQNRALNAIVKFDNDGTFRGGGSVSAAIVMAVREKALTVPEQSVVLRPAGKVVYVLGEKDGRLVAQQRDVETGVRQDGFYEIVKGLAPGDRIAVDGAGFLTNNAVVALPKPRPEAGKGSKKGEGGTKDAGKKA
ncbi:MAG: efflux RND transporter periplasmic adaptor subunit [Proteobacteria bacterium]|nr:efflux RND transporter periplasmic adaptor subunit [Pseudomonadota bacterium]